MRCPYCNSFNYKVYKFIQKDIKNFRYIECSDCKQTYKSVEYIPTNWDYEILYKNILKDITSIVNRHKNNYNKEGDM